MNKIASELIDFGQDFQYENWGSQGEKIASFQSGIEVCRQNGKIHFEYCGQRSVLDDNEQSMAEVVSMVKAACINETT